MSIHDLIQNAKTVNLFSDLSQKNKKIASIKGTISAAIINKRHALRMNQTKFAEYLGCSQSMISKWEAGEYNFTIEKLFDLSEKLDLDFDIYLRPKQTLPISESFYTSRPSYPSTFLSKTTRSAEPNYYCHANKLNQSTSLYSQ